MYVYLLCLGWAPVLVWGIIRAGQGVPSGRPLIMIAVVWMVGAIVGMGYLMRSVGAGS